MPKKFTTENSKATTARARKALVKEEERKKREKEKEDEYWRDDDKYVLKKQQRKDEKEKKKLEQLEKKQTNKLLLENEMSSIKDAAHTSQKMTQAQITLETQNRQKSKTPNKNVAEQEDLLVENTNRLIIDGEEARTVDEAIQILSSKELEIDKHPEKRIKAAFAKFEEENLPRLISENPTLRLSQVKQLLRKEWLKSPSNPLNTL